MGPVLDIFISAGRPSGQAAVLSGVGVRGKAMTKMDGKKTLEENISGGLAELRDLLSKCSTLSVIATSFMYQMRTAHGDEPEKRLTSPAKQIPFLLAVLLSTPEPAEPRDFTEADWDLAKSILERLFFAYMQLYMPTKKQLGGLAPEWYKVREVSMLAFLHYFNNGLLASVQQITERIKLYLTPFDTEISEILGINASQCLAVCQWISKQQQKVLDDVQEVIGAEHEHRIKLLERADHEQWSLEALRAAVQEPSYAEKVKNLFDRISGLGVVRLSELEQNCPGIADVFWRQFSVGRGDGPDIRYPTERSINATSPLVRTSDTEAGFSAVNDLYLALLLMGERTLLESSVRSRFLRARDKALENETLRSVKLLLGPKATIWSEVFETPDCHFEHDVIAVDDGLCLVIEAKATPPIEPFRDPDKAFIRLRDAFRADTGIQKAYEQANHIVRKLKDGHDVPLYDKNGHEVTRLLSDSAGLPIAVCVTRDNFGSLATNLALLLEKHNDDAYPWAINIIDLFNFAEAWSYFKLGGSELRKYLEQRILLHGKVFSDDELDFTGYFMRHGGFESVIKTRADIVQLNPDYSNIFDEVYRHLHLGGPPVDLNPGEPVVMDLRRSLMADQPVFVDPESLSLKPTKIGRNQQCPCGSGKKYKRCCGFSR